MGLERSHYWDTFVQLGKTCCPRCHNTDLMIKWQRHGNRRGWEYRCQTCTQIWREPKITPEIPLEKLEPAK